MQTLTEAPELNPVWSFPQRNPLSGVAGELDSMTAPVGHRWNWRNFLEMADESLLRALRNAMFMDGCLYDSMLIAACCEGYDGMGRVRGRGVWLKPSAIRFAYHALATVDMGISFTEASTSSRWYKESVLNPVRDVYMLLSPPTGKRRAYALTETERRAARAACVVWAAQKDVETPDWEPLSYLTGNYDALSPYFDLIVERRDLSRMFLESLVWAEPLSVVADGIL